MIFIFKSDGSSINYTPATVNQGSIKANTIYFIAPVPKTSVVTAGFTLPNGNGTAKALLSAVEESDLQGIVDTNGQAFNVWQMTAPEVITAYSGTLVVQFFVTANGTTLSTVAIDILVNKGAYTVEPAQGDTYQDVLDYLSAIQTEMSDKMDKVPTATENHIAVFDTNGQVKDGGLPLASNYNDLINKPILNVDLDNLPSASYVANTYYRHTGSSSATYRIGGIYFYDGTDFNFIGLPDIPVIQGGHSQQTAISLRDTLLNKAYGLYLCKDYFSDAPWGNITPVTFLAEYEFLNTGKTVTVSGLGLVYTSSRIFDTWSDWSEKQGVTTTQLGNINKISTIETAYGATIELSMDSSTYVLTAILKNKDGTALSTQTVDLPLESVVVSGSYDDNTKSLILTLQSGSTITIPVSDLIGGLQTEITTQNPLSADLVDDTNTTNKFVSATEKAQIGTNTTDIGALQTGKLDKLTQSTDLTSTSKTLTLTANTRYALGTLSALNITFPATATDGDTIIIEFVSGSTATVLTRDETNAIYNFNSVSADVFVEFNAEFKISVGKWVVYSAETTYTAPVV